MQPPSLLATTSLSSLPGICIFKSSTDDSGTQTKLKTTAFKNFYNLQKHLTYDPE